MKKWLLSIGGLTITVGVAFVLGGIDNRLSIRRYRYHHPKVKESVRAVVITDLHSNLYGERQKDLLAMITQQHPDIVLLVGDIVDEYMPLGHAMHFLTGVAKDYPTYYVTGNHEYYTHKGEEVKQLIRAIGIEVLDNRVVLFHKGRTTLQLNGVDDMEFKALHTQLMSETLKVKDSDALQILLLHRPEVIRQVAMYHYDLVFSGHAHGGQWRIPGILNGVYAPGQNLFPKFAGGEYRINNTTLIVSRGLDTQSHKIPRLYNPPEILVVDIVKG
ncbi:metallophosphoesterase [Aerococcaceae bacterium zg-BR22]|uniref:metallophosphoesterase n=1 Tax=Aerococcaceae bacterium zg-1292 TaxID=2774330 RepID=UPI00406357D4|nr:metallophosphoesterase [Aerococcaceae bacterium zg-BR22]